MDARRRRLVVVASELVQILGGHSSARCEGMVRTKSRTERFSVALTLLEVELGLEEGARLEVEVVREWVVQRTLDAGLVGVVSAFEDVGVRVRMGERLRMTAVCKLGRGAATSVARPRRRIGLPAA